MKSLVISRHGFVWSAGECGTFSNCSGAFLKLSFGQVFLGFVCGILFETSSQVYILVLLFLVVSV